MKQPDSGISERGLSRALVTIPAPTLIFQERAAGALDFDTNVYDVQKLMQEFSLTTPESQRMLWRLLSDNGIGKDAKQATTTTRRQVKDLVKRSGKTAEETLGELNQRGTLLTVRCKFIVPDPGTELGWACR